MTSVQVLSTARRGRWRPASLRPVAFSIARAGARAGPFFIPSLRKTSSVARAKKKAPAVRFRVRGPVELLKLNWRFAPGASNKKDAKKYEAHKGKKRELGLRSHRARYVGANRARN